MRLFEAFIQVCITGAVSVSSAALLIAQCVIAGEFRWFLVVFAVMLLLVVSCFISAIKEYRNELKR